MPIQPRSPSIRLKSVLMLDCHESAFGTKTPLAIDSCRKARTSARSSRSSGVPTAAGTNVVRM